MLPVNTDAESGQTNMTTPGFQHENWKSMAIPGTDKLEVPTIYKAYSHWWNPAIYTQFVHSDLHDDFPEFTDRSSS